MSKSRLEKFLYALYSLDSSDLPNPLSRIEELYKCWVTGEEAPTFEPISRVEKYLMAILGGYDVDELPNPISRVEVLLYKLASGDDNLDDVKSFLSEHEELLAEIIRNGGVGGNIDIEYVLYTLSTKHNTLYNTAEKPVKSAILKGNTLVNLFKNKNNHRDTHKFIYVEEGDKIQATFKDGVTDGWVGFSFKENIPFEIGKTYTVMNELYKGDDQVNTFAISLGNKMFINTKPVIGINKLKITIPSDYTEGLNWMYYNAINTNNSATIFSSNLLILEGDYTQEDIPYFEGMQSVKMPVLTTAGKNLIDINKFVDGFLPDSRPYDTAIPDNFDKTSDYTRVEPNTTYCYSVDTPFDGVQYLRWYFYKEIGAVSDIIPSRKMASGISETTFTTPTDCNYIRICSRGLSLDGATVQLEKSSTPTTHEPFKSNILTVNEEVELRGIGDVQDTLDLVTGEYVQRIGEVVLDGSQSFGKYDDIEGFYTKGFYTVVPNNLLDHITNTSRIICDQIKSTTFNNIQPNFGTVIDSEGLCVNGGYIKFRIDGGKASTVEELNTYLSKNPIKILIPFIEPTIKTVDLSVVNQDGNDTKLSTFNDITHVTLSSEGLIPEAELEVATKNKEDLEVAEKVPEVAANMLGISREQEVINTATNEQSENVDSTMIATTEIYEELL